MLSTMRAVLALSLLVCASVVTLAQTPAGPLPMPKLQFLDSSGRPLGGGKVYTYTAGTSTPLATYTDSTGTVANSNPVILDAGGFGSIWVKNGVYKIVVQNSAGVQQWSADGVTSESFAMLDSAGYISPGLLRYTATGTGAVSRSLTSKLADAASVKDFGALGDGLTDDTAAINAALAASHSVFFPDGNYLINCESSTDGQWTSGGIAPQNNSVLNFGGNAVVKCKASSSGFYVAIRLYATSGVTINGGTLDGQRSLVTAPGGTQSGMGIACTGCSGLAINGTLARNFWGDGFFFTRNVAANVHANNIVVSGIIADNNRRNGLSLESAQNFKAVNSTFKNSNGTAPQFGVDIEPGGTTTLVNNAEFLNCTYSGNTWEGIGVEGYLATDNVTGVKIRGGIVQNNSDNLGGGVYVYSTLSPVEVSGVLIAGNTGSGINVANTTDVILTDNVIVGNNTSSSANRSGIYIQNSTRPHLTGNVIRQGSAGHQVYGVYLPGNTNLYMAGNDLSGSGSTGDYAEVSPVSSLITANKLSSAAYLAGGLGPPVYSPATPALSLANVAQGTGRTYPIEVGAQTADGSYSIGTGDWNADAVLELRGGQYSANNNVGLSNLSGVRFMRGTTATGLENLLTITNTATFFKPISAPSATVTGAAALNSTVTFGSYHSTTGTRFLCVDTGGALVASASACSGT